MSIEEPAAGWPLYERIKAAYRSSTPDATPQQFEAFCVALAEALGV